jgi:hypothetical protein
VDSQCCPSVEQRLADIHQLALWKRRHHRRRQSGPGGL